MTSTIVYTLLIAGWLGICFVVLKFIQGATKKPTPSVPRPTADFDIHKRESEWRTR